MNRSLLLLLLAATTAVKAQTTASVVEVYRIFQSKCTACHNQANPEADLDLEGQGTTELQRAQNVASKLTNINPTNTFAQNKGLKRVYPGRPDRSFLFKKINNGLEPTISPLVILEGHEMPSGSGPGLSDAEKEVIRQWILYGAKTIGAQFNKALVDDFYANGGGRSFPDGPPPAPAPGEGFQIKMGPFFLPPDGEVEYYQKYELSLPANVEVRQLDFNISPYSHHFIVYNFTGNGANNIPAGLRTNALHNQINLVAAVQEATNLTLPNTTAFSWDKNLVLDLNSHYINYSLTQPYQCEAYINVYTQAPGTANQEMFATLLVKPDIPIPNSGDLITHTQAEYQFGADSIYIWGLMGHTHQYGKGYKVWKRLPNGQQGELIYDASCPQGIPGCPTPWFDYQHIPIRYWEPLLPIKWSNGIIHEAQWVNDGPAPVNFGPTSDDEMMVLIAFYTENPVINTTSTQEPGDTVGDLQLWPNPAAGGKVSIAVPELEQIGLLRLLDVSGREVLRREVLAAHQTELDLGALKAGLYYVDAGGRKGKLVVYTSN